MESYENKYKNALKRARECIKDGGISQNTIDYLCNIFPELKESENDRIRRELVAFLKEELETGGRAEKTWDMKGLERWISWIEKQGKQDAMETQNEEILQAISIGLTDIIEDFGWSDFGGLPIEEIQSWLEKQQSEQKPFDYENATIIQKDFSPKKGGE